MSHFQPAAIFRALDESAVDYVAVGAVAVIAHGVVRATIDVDLIPDPNRENLERLGAALVVLDAKPDGEPETAVSAEVLDRDANMRFQAPAGQIDVLLAGQYRRLYEQLKRGSVEVEVAGTRIVVVSRNDLIRLKAATGRDRDLLDIGDLLALDE